MKRVALLVILGIGLVHLTRLTLAPPPRPPAWSAPQLLPVSAPGPRPPLLRDEPPAPPAAKKKAARRVEPKPAAPPAAPAPPAVAAKTQPDWYPRDAAEEETLARPDARGVRVLVGALSATEDKARLSLRRKVAEEVTKWLAGDVVPGWEPPAHAIDGMSLATYVQPVAESLGDVSKDLDDLYTLYRAGARLDFSPARRSQVVALYEHDLVRGRMLKGAGLLAFVLFVLAVLAGYIRVDESTKGYYTNRLRMLAAAGVGAAGVVVYRMLA